MYKKEITYTLYVNMTFLLVTICMYMKSALYQFIQITTLNSIILLKLQL